MEPTLDKIDAVDIEVQEIWNPGIGELMVKELVRDNERTAELRFVSDPGVVLTLISRFSGRQYRLEFETPSEDPTLTKRVTITSDGTRITHRLATDADIEEFVGGITEDEGSQLVSFLYGSMLRNLTTKDWNRLLVAVNKLQY